MARTDPREPDPLQAALAPRSIVVVGASEDANKTGGRAIQILRQFGYGGRIFAINPNRAEVQGIKAHRQVSELPEAPDLAIIALPAAAAVRAVDDCAARGIKAAIVTTSGFAETGAEGAAMQRAMTARARAAGMRIVGPNSQGLANFGNGTVASFSSILLETPPADGPVAVISQSGAMSVVPYYWLREHGFGVRHAHSTGNDSDVTVADLTLAIVEDPTVRLILVYLESLADPDTLARAAAIARERDVPIVALKAGRSSRGQAAALSHTGALATEDRVVDAFFARHGIWRVEDADELVQGTALYLKGWRPAGRRLVVLSDSGATGVMACDMAERLGLSVADLSPPTQQALRAVLPPFAATANPIDLTAALRTDVHLFEDSLRILGDVPAVDMVFVGFPASGAGYDLDTFARAGASFGERTGKPIVIAIPQPEKARLFAAAGIPTFQSETVALKALRQLAGHSDLMSRRLPDMKVRDHRPLPAQERSLDESESLAFLKSHGLPTVDHRLCTTLEEALDAFRSLRPPAVLKGCSPALPHKSEHGLVALNIGDEATLAQAFARLDARLSELGVARSGIIVAPMIRGQREMFVGARWDPVFGPVVLVGDGGTNVEAMEDVAVMLPPLSQDEIREAIGRLQFAPILKGTRGAPPVDVEAVCRIAADLAAVICASRGAIDSIDLNPVIVGSAGEGATIVDAMVERSAGNERVSGASA